MRRTSRAAEEGRRKGVHCTERERSALGEWEEALWRRWRLTGSSKLMHLWSRPVIKVLGK